MVAVQQYTEPSTQQLMSAEYQAALDAQLQRNLEHARAIAAGQLHHPLLYPDPPDPRPLSERREANVLNISYGLHRCSDAEFKITSGMLRELGACSDRFSRLERAGGEDATLYVDHSALESMDSDDYFWFLSAVADRGFYQLEQETQRTLELTMSYILNMHGVDEEQLTGGHNETWARIMRNFGNSVAPYRSYVGAIDLEQQVRRFALIDEAQARGTQRVLDLCHAIIELRHHGWLYIPGQEAEAETNCCDPETNGENYVEQNTRSIIMTVDVTCPCGETDQVEIELDSRSSEYEWECPSCQHTHYLARPAVNYR